MNTFAEVGVIYIYIMLVLLVIGLGFLLFRGFENLTNSFSKDKQDIAKINKKTQEEPWIRVVFLSATFLFLAVFTLGVLKTIGVGDDQHSQHHSAAASTSVSKQVNTQDNSYTQQQLQSQINDMSNQINLMEQELYNN